VVTDRNRVKKTYISGSTTKCQELLVYFPIHFVLSDENREGNFRPQEQADGRGGRNAF
jgi:hypothetical protein